MNDSGKPRRRIARPEGPRRSGGGKTDPWIITIIAAVVVVAGGWFLGQGLAHMLGSRDQQRSVASAPTTVAVTPVPSASANESPAPSPSASPLPSPSASASPRGSAPHPVVKPAATPSKKPAAPPVTPTPVATATQTPPTPSPTPALLPKPTATPTPHVTHSATAAPKPPAPAAPAGENAGEATVRAYIDALRRGDPTAAAAYLGNGAPDEDFIDESTRVQSLTSSANADGSYRVRVTMQTAKGQFNETFVVAGSGNSARILEKTASKP